MLRMGISTLLDNTSTFTPMHSTQKLVSIGTVKYCAYSLNVIGTNYEQGYKHVI